MEKFNGLDNTHEVEIYLLMEKRPKHRKRDVHLQHTE